MLLRRKPLVAGLASLAVLLLVGVLVQRALAAGGPPTPAAASSTPLGGQAPFAPCPASWYPLDKQPEAIQKECADLKAKALLDERATAQARPWRASTPPTPDPRFSNYPPAPDADHIPSDWLGTRRISQEDVFQGYNNHWPGISDVWQVGVTLNPGQSGIGRVVVYAAGPYVRLPDGPNNQRPLVDRRVFPWGNFQDGRIPSNSVWVCPRALGALTITNITGPTGVVSFTSTSGVSGTLDMATGAWTFGQ
jgi:hypothetical protein